MNEILLIGIVFIGAFMLGYLVSVADAIYRIIKKGYVIFNGYKYNITKDNNE